MESFRYGWSASDKGDVSIKKELGRVRKREL